MLFADRYDAGRRLATRLAGYRDADPVVFALPRGGVPVGFEVASALDAPLEVLVARKLGAPGRPELGIGAIAEGGARVVDERASGMFDLAGDAFEATVAEEQAELERRVRQYRGDRDLPDVAGRTVVLVDDGLATGVTARAAVRALRQRRPARLVLAVPVCAPATAAALAAEVDDLVYVAAPERFTAVGQWYDDFAQTTDATVVDLLERARGER